MKSAEICEKLELKCLTGKSGSNNDVLGVYCCDLLSWVIAHAQSHSAWLTIQGHINTIAVAILTGISCIILVENAQADDDTIKKAIEEEVAIFSTSKSAYQIAKELSKMGL